MPNLTAPPLTYPVKSFPTGAGLTSSVPSGIAGELLTSGLLPGLSHLVKSGRVHTAYAKLTTPAVFSTAGGAGLGGPLLWNPPLSGVDAHLLAVSAVTVTAATSSVGGLGWSSGVLATAPTSTTAIDAQGNALIGGPASALSAYQIGTVTTVASSFMPLIQVDTGALGVQNMTPAWIPLDGAFAITPGTWGAVTGSVLFTTLVIYVGLMWAELPT